ncbi:MAG: carbamate kinase [Phycisphaerales bacterium]|nr:carbamate kinase [Phycisphaerales bacterium]
MMRIVVAIGGNALVGSSGIGDIHEQFARSRVVAKPLADLVEQGLQLTVTHGNGPQVGSVMRRVEIASTEVYPIDLGLAVADTQAGMGYMICQTLRNELRHRGKDRISVAIVTTVEVDHHDPAFENPSKPIGSFMDEPTARRHEKQDGWKVIEDSGRGYRRVVPSPRPLGIIQMPTIKKLVEAGDLVVAGGGGGIPVVLDENGDYQGVEAVIDKDLTSAIIASEIEADVLALVTAVDGVYINYRRPDQEVLRHVNVARIEALIAENQFPEGSMLPKIKAAIQFLKSRKSPTARAVIADLPLLSEALAGQTGTTIVLD